MRLASLRGRGLRRSRPQIVWLPRIDMPCRLSSQALFKVLASLASSSVCRGGLHLRLPLCRCAFAASN